MGVVRCPKMCIYFDSRAAEVEALLISACAGKSCKFQHSKRDKNFTASVCASVCVCVSVCLSVCECESVYAKLS